MCACAHLIAASQALGSLSDCWTEVPQPTKKAGCFFLLQIHAQVVSPGEEDAGTELPTLTIFQDASSTRRDANSSSTKHRSSLALPPCISYLFPRCFPPAILEQFASCCTKQWVTQPKKYWELGCSSLLPPRQAFQHAICLHMMAWAEGTCCWVQAARMAILSSCLHFFHPCLAYTWTGCYSTTGARSATSQLRPWTASISSCTPGLAGPWELEGPDPDPDLVNLLQLLLFRSLPDTLLKFLVRDSRSKALTHNSCRVFGNNNIYNLFYHIPNEKNVAISHQQ